MIIPGQRSLPLSVHDRFVITFTTTLFHINWLRRFSSPRETPHTHHNRQGLRVPDLRRYPSENPTFHTARYQRTFRAVRLCAHGNRQQFCIGRRGPRGSS